MRADRLSFGQGCRERPSETTDQGAAGRTKRPDRAPERTNSWPLWCLTIASRTHADPKRAATVGAVDVGSLGPGTGDRESATHAGRIISPSITQTTTIGWPDDIDMAQLSEVSPAKLLGEGVGDHRKSPFVITRFHDRDH